MEFNKLTVLVVDDNPHLHRLITTILNQHRVGKILQAGDGREALKEVDYYGEKIDVIICDLEMPNLNGIDFIHRLRAGDTPNIPVVVVTALSSNSHMKSAINAGINGFLAKPIKPGPLISRIKAAINSEIIRV